MSQPKDESMTIFPTHRCFDDALDFIAERVKAEPALAQQTTLILVHGIAVAPNGPHQGERFAHAWVEENDFCWDSGILDGLQIYYSVARDDYYQSLQVQQTTRYTIREAWLENARSETFGPWIPEYSELCGRNSDRVYGAVPAEVGFNDK